MLAWALAIELDDAGWTDTGERVCRACGGRGTTDQWATIAPDDQWWEQGPPDGEMRISDQRPCPCDGPTRPDNMSLAHIVREIASLPRPTCVEIPPAFHVAADRAADHGGPAAVWWREFLGWVTVGRGPDADALAVALLPFVELREAARKRPDILDDLGLRDAILGGRAPLGLSPVAVAASRWAAAVESLRTDVRVLGGDPDRVWKLACDMGPSHGGAVAVLSGFVECLRVGLTQESAQRAIEASTRAGLSLDAILRTQSAVD